VTSRPIRVLHLLNSMTGWGCGIVNAALDIISGQKKESMEIAVCSGGGELVPLLEGHGIRHFQLTQKRTIADMSRAVGSFRRVVREFRPDIVHSHMITGTILARAVRFGMPYRVVAHVHNIHQRSSVLMGFADSLIAVSDAVALEMIAHGVPAKKIHVVRNGTLGSIRLPDPDEVAPAHLEQPSIVTVAGMNHRKGIAELIVAFERIWRRLPESHLYLVGGGPDRAEFEAQAAASPMRAHIHFEGFREDPIPYMKAASVFVLASRRDSFPLVLPEARQCGCAIVATSVDGIPEALENGRAGLLVPPQNPGALSDAILRLLEDPAEATGLRLRSRQNLDVFRVERVAAQITEVYMQLLKTSPAAWPDLDSAQAENIRCA